MNDKEFKKELAKRKRKATKIYASICKDDGAIMDFNYSRDAVEQGQRYYEKTIVLYQI